MNRTVKLTVLCLLPLLASCGQPVVDPAAVKTAVSTQLEAFESAYHPHYRIILKNLLPDSVKTCIFMPTN